MQVDKDSITGLIREKLRILAPQAKAILFGSRARGNPGPDSDWDILVLLDKEKIDSTDFDEIAYPLFELGWSLNQQISVKLYTINEWRKRSFTPFYKNVEQEGVLL
jgi:predicted nucleotidyltransferase